MSYSMSMNLQNKQSLKQNQRLMMSPQMQQAIHMLQMPVMELTTMIEAELEQNPVLEYSEETESLEAENESLEEAVQEESTDLDTQSEREVVIDDHDFDVLKRLDEDFRDHFAESGGASSSRTQDDDKLQSFLESSICSVTTLFQHLMEQAQESFEDPEECKMAEAIIGDFDERGFFTGSLEELALLNGYELDKLLEILEEIQTFDPSGVGARTLPESLLIQLTKLKKKNSLAYAIIEKHFDDLTHNKIPLIQKGLGRSAAEIRHAVDSDIAKLDLHPGYGYSKQVVQSITSDVCVRDEDGIMKVEVNNDCLPSLRLNRRYLKMLEDPSLSAETKEYVKQKVMSSKWLLRNIHQRNETIERIVTSLVKRQYDFFSQSEGKLTPLTMKMVAEELGLHESTIARAVANKYVDCPRGLLSLRSFFTNAYVTQQGEDISSSTVKEALLAIIEAEDKNKPYSDETISEKLKEKGINCARRTVAKYRTLYNIGNTTQRKKYQ